MPSNIPGKIVVGITGGIGTGKSLAGHYFEKAGFKVINADSFTRALYQKEPKLKTKLVKAFGNGILDVKGNISGPAARKIIFGSAVSIKRVNRIVHPFVMQAIESEIKKLKSKIVFVETAIAFESGYYKKLDYILLVTSPVELRVQRVAKRDGAKPADIEKLIKLQSDDKLKAKKSDFIINNSGRNIDLKKTVFALCKVIEKLK